jgi:23S rRNA pseudouridine955/2504/2580 synthase
MPNKETTVSQVSISAEEAGQRLDNFLIKWAKGVPKSHIYRIIRSGEVRVNKKRADVTTRIVEGDVLRIPPIRVSAPKPEDLIRHNLAQSQKVTKSIPILFEDDAVLIVDKPSGLAVHGGSGVSLGLIEALRAGRPELKFLELVHRLDRDTSGILMLAKKRSALVALHEQIRAGKIDKRYLLVGHGQRPASSKGIPLKYPLLKYLLPNGERRVKVDENGQESYTILKVLGPAAEGRCILGEAQLKTGRTHQIRVHLKQFGHPLVGDEKYGDSQLDKQVGGKRLMLHAYKLIFTHPKTGEKKVIESAPPAGFQLDLV